MKTRVSIALAAALLAVFAEGSTAHGAIGLEPARQFVPHEVIVKLESQRVARTRELPPGVGVREAAAALRSNPAVEYASPNYIATASTSEEPPVPNDPGTLTGLPGVPGGWVSKQWNLLPWEGTPTALLPTSPGGIDAVGAWQNLEATRHPGALGVTVAVLDTGIAYRALGSRFR